jgi:hypothetical protein
MPAKSQPAQAHKFVATIYKIGINRCVDVPPDISGQFQPAKYVAVVTIIGGRTSRTTLVPGAEGYRLFLNSQMRKAAHVDAGDLVGVLLRLDRESRELPIPPELEQALDADAAARDAFAAITPALRREFLRWVLAAKSSETRVRRIQRGLKTLIDRVSARKQAKSGARSRSK